MRVEAPGLRYVSAERIGGGVAADGMGELSKLLLGRRPAAALRLARDTGILVEVLPELESAVGYSLGTERQPLPLDEHVFEVVQEAADVDASLPVRLAALLHDLGKPQADLTGHPHAQLGAGLAARVLRRLRYPTHVRRYVVEIVAGHAFRLDEPIDARYARRFLAAHGDTLAVDLVAHKRADLRAKHVGADEHERLDRLEGLLVSEGSSPHRIADLAVDGRDLIETGFTEGPALGRVLAVLLDEVLDEPARNTRETLLARAHQELA
jgi:tRNA nucleotidyltransferase/poly(A) polymerase